MISTLFEEDYNDRAEALDINKSFIVQAPAGSGKTELLIQRFLLLLTTVNEPQEILSITFTKKAANEMRLRVLKALKNAMVESEPVEAHAKKTWIFAKKVLERDHQFNWKIIENPNQLRIQTIDSLCTSLTKQLPLLSHFGSQPEIADNPIHYYRIAATEVLMHVEHDYPWSKDIANLLLHLDNDLNKLHELLVSLLAKRDQWLPYAHIDSNQTSIRKKFEKNLAKIIATDLTRIRDLFPTEYIEILMSIVRFAESNKRVCDATLLSLTDLPEPIAENKKYWLVIANLLLTKSCSWRKRLERDLGFPPLSNLKNPEEKARHNEFRELHTNLINHLERNENLRIAMSELLHLPNATYHDNQWQILNSLLNVLKVVAAQCRITFQEHGVIDFIENAQAALLALGDDSTPTDLALAFDYQLKHILVDEFQDTSFVQYQLLEKLIYGWQGNDGRTLFVVGDPMQSIYRFREAEVGLFIRMLNHGIGGIKLIPLKLAINFRSDEQIVNWNNNHFAAIFPTYNDIGTGAVKYSSSIAKHANNSTVAVKIKGLTSDNDSEQANQIIKLIQETKAANPEESIAILVRSRSHLSAIIPALKKNAIEYQAHEIDALSSRQHIQDLLSLTCALFHPADRIAWLSILRAPWCGLTLSDLLIIAESDTSTIFSRLSRTEVLEKLSKDGRHRVKRFYQILKSKLAERERYDIRSYVENTWILLGGPATLNDGIELNDIEAYLKLLSSFSYNNQIFNLDKLKENINNLFASTQHENAIVQIMTIHSAKGLEFDTVILPHLERKMPYDDKSLLSWMEQPLENDEHALLLAPIHETGSDNDMLYDYINRRQKRKAYYEADRLFYVATTRAKKRMYLFFNCKTDADNDIKIESGSFLAKLWPLIEKDKSNILEYFPEAQIETHISSEIKPKYIKRLSDDWKNPIKETTSKALYFHHQEDGFKLKDNYYQLVGILVHRILELVAKQSIDWWQEKIGNKSLNYIQHHLQQLGLAKNKLFAGTGLVSDIITKTLKCEKGLWILTSQKSAKSEFALTACLNSKVQHLVIDRTFIDENNIRWIIDYKTTTFTTNDMETFILKEQEKYKNKMELYAKAMRLQEDNAIKLGLYFPALQKWHEWDYLIDSA